MNKYEFVLALDTQSEIDETVDKLFTIDGIISATVRDAQPGCDGDYPNVVVTTTGDAKAALAAWYYGTPDESDMADFDEMHLLS